MGERWKSVGCLLILYGGTLSWRSISEHGKRSIVKRIQHLVALRGIQNAVSVVDAQPFADLVLAPAHVSTKSHSMQMRSPGRCASGTANVTVD